MRRKHILVLIVLILLITAALTLTACKRDDAATGESRAEYVIELAVREGFDEAYLTEEVTFCNATGARLTELVFCLYPNAYGEGAEDSAYFADMLKTNKEFGGIDISNVKSDGEERAFDVSGIWLTVPLGEGLDEGESVTLKLGARIDLPSGTLRFGGNDKTVRLVNFYPVLACYGDSGWERNRYSRIGDPFHTWSASYDVTVSAPENVSIATSGRLISYTVDKGIKTVKAALDEGRDFAAVLSTDYSLYEASLGDVKVNYYSSSGDDKASFTAEALGIMSEYIGDFPYPEFTVCESPFYYGGMEYPGLVIVNDALGGAEKEKVIVHEIIHQWIGCAVGSDGVNESWVDESLTTYLTAYYFKLKGDEAAFRAEVDNCERQFAAFLMTEKLSSPGYVPSMNRSVYEFSTLNEYDAVVYRRGCAMYASLTELAGEKKMREAVREYYSRYKYLNATGEDLVSCFEDVMGEKARTVIYSYLNADVKCGFVAA